MNAVVGKTLTYTVTAGYPVVACGDVITISATGAFNLLTSSGTTAANSIFTDAGFPAGFDAAGVALPDMKNASSYKGVLLNGIAPNAAGTGIMLSRLLPAVRVTDATTPTPVQTIVTGKINVISAATDNLFSNDQMLKTHEVDIMKYLPDGRATFKHIHRLAQTEIFGWFDKEGYVDVYRRKLSKDQIKDVGELREWSAHKALQLIFEGVSNAKDDVFAKKAASYAEKTVAWANKAVIRLDLDRSGQVELGEEMEDRSGLMVRR
jgi:hypothetical protein